MKSGKFCSQALVLLFNLVASHSCTISTLLGAEKRLRNRSFFIEQNAITKQAYFFREASLYKPHRLFLKNIFINKAHSSSSTPLVIVAF